MPHVSPLCCPGYSKTYVEVLLWRLVLGFGQAFSNPASYSLIADYFPENQRAQANGLFACGVYIGGGMASMCISMAAGLGWRDTCFLIAAIGFGFSAIEGLAVREPGRGKAKEEAAAGGAGAAGGADGAEAPKKTFKQALGAIFSNRLVVLVFAASSLRYMGGYAIAGYLPTFYGVVFPSYDDQYSYINAYVVATGGFLSSWLGGMAADKWRAVFEEYFPPPKETRQQSQDLNMVEAEQFAEEGIDDMRRQKRDELIKMRKAAEFEAKMADASRMTDANGSS